MPDAPPLHPAPRHISPHLALDLRIRFLEPLIAPASSSSAPPSTPPTPLARRVAHLGTALETALDAHPGTDAVRRFVHNYDLNAPLLSPALAVPAPAPADAPDSPAAQLALVLEAEGDLRTLERELRELALLDERGVAGAGKLGEHEALKPTLVEVQQGVKPVAASCAELETRTTALLQRYNDYIGTMSELFVSWDEILTDAEAQVARLEKERRRAGEYDIS
ncbi:hypothetical protein JCM10450v2_001643 [Rhodotorula kratochvilovae]